MPKVIQPLDKNLTPLDLTPDRSNLSKLYTHEKGAEPPVRTDEFKHSTVTLQPQDVILINLLLAAPYICSFLSIAAIYSLSAPADINSAATYRLFMTLWTITTFLPWIISMRILRSRLLDYGIRLPALLFIYSLFIFPLLDASIALRSSVSDIFIVVATILLSQMYISLIAFALNSEKSIPLRTAPALILLLTAICLAIFT